MRIVVDAMGGDQAPGAVVKGAVEAARELGVEVILVGRDEEVRRELAHTPPLSGSVSVVHAAEVITPGEAPVSALRRKKESSISVGLGMVRRGEADALVSAGSTGALMAGALLTFGRIKGIDRPALGGVFPSLVGSGVVVLDLGANLGAGPQSLFQYGVMGSVYAEKVLGISNPRVALLNVGEEEAKGNEAVQRAFSLMKEGLPNFSGNIEGRDILSGKADVVVCDGFVGNALLKFGEGLVDTLFGLLREEVGRGLVPRLGVLLLMPALRRIKRRMDYTEYGGAPFLGVDGICIKCHGSSNARAIKNGIRAAREAVAGDLRGVIRATVATTGCGTDGASG